VDLRDGGTTEVLLVLFQALAAAEDITPAGRLLTTILAFHHKMRSSPAAIVMGLITELGLSDLTLMDTLIKLDAASAAPPLLLNTSRPGPVAFSAGPLTPLQSSVPFPVSAAATSAPSASWRRSTARGGGSVRAHHRASLAGDVLLGAATCRTALPHWCLAAGVATQQLTPRMSVRFRRSPMTYRRRPRALPRFFPAQRRLPRWWPRARSRPLRLP
jgi:hypothetical protein